MQKLMLPRNCQFLGSMKHVVFGAVFPMEALDFALRKALFCIAISKGYEAPDTFRR